MGIVLIEDKIIYPMITQIHPADIAEPVVIIIDTQFLQVSLARCNIAAMVVIGIDAPYCQPGSAQFRVAAMVAVGIGTQFIQ